MSLIVFKIQNAAAQPIAGALLSAESPNGPWQGLTDACGRFDATLTPGHYDITVSAAGYTTRLLPADLADPGIVTIGLESGLMPKPTRDQLCAVKMSFQGLTFSTPSYGPVFWWETLAWWPNLADREAAYAAKRAAGDTHCILDLTGAYKEGIPGVYNDIGADYSQNLPALVALAQEAIAHGFLIDLRLGGDGQGAGPDYNDPVGHTYGHDWLMANLDRIMDAFAPIYRYIVWVPGYDGIFYGWEPEQCMAFAAKIRARWPDAVIGLEFNVGHIPLGEGGGDFQPGGRMKDYDVIYGEFDPFNYHQSSTWQIVGRLVHPYTAPPDQNDGDTHPPFYLVDSARGPRPFIAFEVLTYNWVRGRCGPEEPAAYRAYFAAMGCERMC